MRLAATVGFLAGAVPPLVRGILIIVDETYVDPHSCGFGLYAGWMHVLFLAPIGGVLGAAIGCGCLAVYRTRRRTETYGRFSDRFSN
jgi:hypothetical protein